MKRQVKRGVSWLEFPLFSSYPHLVQGVFLRHKGVSKGAFASLNVGAGIGDNEEHVKENLEIIRALLGIERLVQGNQVHGTQIVQVEKNSPSLVDECDGLITEKRGLGLLIKHADCQAALFFDPKKEIIGAAHAGWRGNVKQIYTKMVSSFAAMGSRPEDLLVAISPSLGPDHAEFKEYRKMLPKSFWPFQVAEGRFDLWAVAKKELLEAGVLEKNLQIASLCSFCHPKDFFSYRRNPLTGRNGTVIALKS
ncbi:MAG: hypothetical protein A3G30_05450 [Chlamydiae bacterium RIFCSPLOWO2_12_FULL_49_12]|nr:MAG: hypothetical protein A2098_03320 [Chlamydiae bacterium GWF2_49_8]OGN58044.1 MAG: hypothetical protein A3D18_02945 [Chlamydiae bacterium RIFCSPHIGHO2_02_FULL_49_29]OGN62962.1 MAG: hypothetical protein A3E26_02170 [Chlamydiae bacterium RIFCSPHIGHO2_12_FULL_49_32]OGN68869.1 MAG: hypothetical protein A3I15_00350 [Chlamydiae bacterium RIFCSPLOWO2_02_FULL_49_12]OGN75249.1 MAG: hypothetical protein A3G30_05450 [Chlamydiae bacterium RIFCSPLOWO2_12_FULL_49_12]